MRDNLLMTKTDFSNWNRRTEEDDANNFFFFFWNENNLFFIELREEIYRKRKHLGIHLFNISGIELN